jgi:hypothetical protein
MLWLASFAQRLRVYYGNIRPHGHEVSILFDTPDAQRNSCSWLAFDRWSRNERLILADGGLRAARELKLVIADQHGEGSL